MRRRDAIIGPLLAATMGRAQAQQTTKVYSIALASPTVEPGVVLSETSTDRHVREFFQELRQLGYVQGRNIDVEAFSGEGRSERFPKLVRDVVDRNPDVIIALTNPLVREFQAATTAIPIIGIMASPAADGTVRSVARPGGNTTGVSVDSGLEVWGKRLELLKEAVPSVAKVGWLAVQSTWQSEYAQVVQDAGERLGISIIGPPLQTPIDEREYRRVFTTMAQRGADGLYVSNDIANYSYRQWVADLDKEFHLPGIFSNREQAQLGGLMAYTVDGYALWRQAADQIDQILRGTSPGDIPIYQPRKFDLIINLKAAKTLGIEIPSLLLARADEVIE